MTLSVGGNAFQTSVLREVENARLPNWVLLRRTTADLVDVDRR